MLCVDTLRLWVVTSGSVLTGCASCCKVESRVVNVPKLQTPYPLSSVAAPENAQRYRCNYPPFGRIDSPRIAAKPSIFMFVLLLTNALGYYANLLLFCSCPLRTRLSTGTKQRSRDGYSPRGSTYALGAGAGLCSSRASYSALQTRMWWQPPSLGASWTSAKSLTLAAAGTPPAKTTPLP